MILQNHSLDQVISKTVNSVFQFLKLTKTKLQFKLLFWLVIGNFQKIFKKLQPEKIQVFFTQLSSSFYYSFLSKTLYK